MVKLLNEILTNESVSNAITVLIVGLLSFLSVKVATFTTKENLHKEQILEQSKSNKRSALRNEYMNIFNSRYFTQEQKYEMTRDIIQQYYQLHGNHYMSELDEQLKQSAGEENATNDLR